MYPSGELARLARHKATLRLRIAHRRLECAEALAGVERPLQWLDRAIAWWHKVRPLAKLAAVPLALLARRKIFRHLGLLGTVLRWAPILVTVVRGVTAIKRERQPA